MTIQERLLQMRDEKYAAFQLTLMPTVEKDRCIGARVPYMRTMAKELIKKEEDYSLFLKQLPHYYYDENMLHGLLISEMKDFDVCILETDRFLPFVDNWAVCDVMSPKVFIKNKEKLLAKIKEWAASEHVYTCRFGIGMLMRHFLDKDYNAEYLATPAAVHTNEYYVKMMVAWFFATALSKQWDTVFPYMQNGVLDIWTHNKTIQKATESYRITAEQKEILRALRRK